MKVEIQLTRYMFLQLMWTSLLTENDYSSGFHRAWKHSAAMATGHILNIPP